jgi:ubiquinone/menaquinone biosynthesis C-methylase UbiE
MPYDQDVQAFDDRAATYESGRHGRLHREISDRVVALALTQVPVPERVLDVGSGTGYVLRQLAARLSGTAGFLGVDAAPRMVQVARRGTDDPRVTFTHGAAERLPADDDAYDLVVSTTSFDHWTDQAAGIRECARVLRLGGTLVLTDQFAQFLWPMLRSRRNGKACTRTLATDLITSAGLTQVEWHPCYAQIIQTVIGVK